MHKQTSDFSGWLDHGDVWFRVQSKYESYKGLCGLTNDSNDESFGYRMRKLCTCKLVHKKLKKNSI